MSDQVNFSFILPKDIYEKGEAIMMDLIWVNKDNVPVFPFALAAEQMARVLIDAVKNDIIMEYKKQANDWA